MKELIGKIEKYQVEHQLSDAKFCALIGMDRSTWFNIRKGRRNPGEVFLKKVTRKIPELQMAVFSYIAGDNHDNMSKKQESK